MIDTVKQQLNPEHFSIYGNWSNLNDFGSLEWP